MTNRTKLDEMAKKQKQIILRMLKRIHKLIIEYL